MFLPERLSKISVLPREPQPDDIAGTTKNIHFIVIYDVLFGVGWALLCIIFLTAVLARKVQRTPMWIVSVAAWVIYSFANLMMVGLQDNTPPVYTLCLLQATLIYASPVFCALIVASFLLQTYCSMSRQQWLYRLVQRRSSNMWFYIIPIAFSLGVLIITLVMGLVTHDIVQKDPSLMYCHLTNPLLSMLSGGLTIIGMLAIYTIEGLILLSVYRRSGKYTISRGMMLRMGVFSFWALVILVLSLLQYIPSSVRLDNAKVEIVEGTLPCIGAIAFGTKRDLFEIWMFWKKRQVATLPEFAENERGGGETAEKVVVGS